MSNILNLDEIETGTEKAFSYKGKTYEMKPLSVGDFIKQSKELKKIAETDEAGSIEFLVKTVCSAFPDLDEKTAKTMNMDHLNALMKHIQGDVTEEMEEGNAS